MTLLLDEGSFFFVYLSPSALLFQVFFWVEGKGISSAGQHGCGRSSRELGMRAITAPLSATLGGFAEPLQTPRY